MRSVFKKVRIGILSVLTLLIIFAFWYTWQYSMSKAESFEVNNPNLSDRVLIASQGSRFKMRVVSSIKEHLKNKEVYIKVIDISGLKDITEESWNVIVILHTWEYNRPPENASDFIDKMDNLEKLIVISTSVDGNKRIRGIDGVSSASAMSEVPDVVEFVISKINEKLTLETSMIKLEH